MKLKVLGCSGSELPTHHSPAFLLDNTVLFDAGSIGNVLDEKEQEKIGHIFITHAHLDHIKGIPFLADNLIIRDKGKTVRVMSIDRVIRTLKRHLFNKEVWPDFTMIPHPDRGVLSLETMKAGMTHRIDGYFITPVRVEHTVPAVGYLVENMMGKRFFYTGDTGPTPMTWKKLQGIHLDGLIIETSFPNSMEELSLITGHLTPELLQRETELMNPPPSQIFITHPKPQYFGKIAEEIRALKRNEISILIEGQEIIL